MKTATTKEKDSTRSRQKTARVGATAERAAKAGAKKPMATKTVAAKEATATKKRAKKVAAQKPAAKAVTNKPAAKTTKKLAETASKTAVAEPAPTGGVPAARPSERLLAARAEMPTERPLTEEERDAMAKVSETARRYVGAEGAPDAIVKSIAAFVEEVRAGKREEPKNQDVRLGLGVLWGEQVRAQVGWSWVHLTYPDGFASYAVVPDDRAFACFPLNRIPDSFQPSGPNTSAQVFESIREGSLPARKPNAYLVIG
jgi:hypothetical protein